MTEHTRLYPDLDGHLAVETCFRVRYHETDAMRVVHHSAYILWFEEGRSAFTRAIGYPYARMEAEGVALAVTELCVRYRQPARYDDEVIVTTRLEQLRSREITFSYTVRRACDDVVLATGSTRLVAVDAQGHVRRLPDELRARVSSYAAVAP